MLHAVENRLLRPVVITNKTKFLKELHAFFHCIHHKIKLPPCWMVEATGIKNVASGSTSMASPAYQISLKPAYNSKSYLGRQTDRSVILQACFHS
jgi:hypothetical protein